MHPSTGIARAAFDAPAVFCRVLDADKGGYPRSEGYDVGSSRRILRHLEGLQGEVELTIEFKPTFDYVRAHTRVETCSAGGAIARADGQYLTLGSAGIQLNSHSDLLSGRLRLRAGEHRWIVLTHADNDRDARQALHPTDCEQQLERTFRYWQEWANKCGDDSSAGLVGQQLQLFSLAPHHDCASWSTGPPTTGVRAAAASGRFAAARSRSCTASSCAGRR